MRFTVKTPWLWAAVLTLSVSGCFTRPSRGENGVVELAWDEGALGCIFGCDAREPMAAHANAGLDVVNADEIPTFVVSSTDDTILEFEQSSGAGDSSIRVISHEEGSAHIVFSRTDGEELDRYELEVRDVARIELASPVYRDRYLLLVGGSDSLSLDLYDARDRRLEGYGGVEYTLSGSIGESELTLVSALAEAIARAFVGSTSERASVEALAVGSGQIDITAPSGTSLSIPVEVVDESAVSRIEVDDEMAETGSGASMVARAYADDGEQIHDPACTWSIEPADGDITISSTGRESATVVSDAIGNATVVCTIGAVSGSGTITYVMPAP